MAGTLCAPRDTRDALPARARADGIVVDDGRGRLVAMIGHAGTEERAGWTADYVLAVGKQGVRFWRRALFRFEQRRPGGHGAGTPHAPFGGLFDRTTGAVVFDLARHLGGPYDLGDDWDDDHPRARAAEALARRALLSELGLSGWMALEQLLRVYVEHTPARGAGIVPVVLNERFVRPRMWWGSRRRGRANVS